MMQVWPNKPRQPLWRDCRKHRSNCRFTSRTTQSEIRRHGKQKKKKRREPAMSEGARAPAAVGSARQSRLSTLILGFVARCKKRRKHQSWFKVYFLRKRSHLKSSEGPSLHSWLSTSHSLSAHRGMELPPQANTTQRSTAQGNKCGLHANKETCRK